MEYISLILGMCLVLFVALHCVPAAWQRNVKWIWLVGGITTSYAFLTAPYRLARLWQDITYLLG